MTEPRLLFFGQIRSLKDADEYHLKCLMYIFQR